ncbi:unnamed protein product [Notodromas monacha]|uniref:Major facilitator superfamily (MFS) profile domain-containing protein n=1 Tax=Notodromas monacha TaxID=399045 RepID=A0A7R9GCU9_9CRUS|nr:unnamed protein product [Notodromas monacha]CAG0916232.1 unnamed protein product [Notodromas monacha]
MLVQGLSLLLTLAALVDSAAIPTKIGGFSGRVDQSGVTVSGLSSGGAFATQFHVAYSELVTGAGIIAGAPYHCAGGNLIQATYCQTLPSMVSVSSMVSDAESFARTGKIDSLDNLSNDRVYIYHSSLDTTVNIGAGHSVRDFYENFMPASSITIESGISSSHGIPTENYGDACYSFLSSTYILECGYSAAFEAVNYLYGGINPAAASAPGTLSTFSQGDFVTGDPAAISMADTGYVYIPTNCETDDSVCKLHVVFHGCRQGIDALGDIYVKHAGYLEVAESNDIVLLFPQVKASIFSPQNPLGCWDWWGYDDALFADKYATKEGPQMEAVYNMYRGNMLENIPCRYTLAVLAFLGFVYNYSMRINMNIVIVAMINYTAIPHISQAEQAKECSVEGDVSHLINTSSPLVPVVDTHHPSQEGEFAWNEEQQGLVLGSFFWGYIVTQIPGGRVGELYGVKRVFGLGLMVAALLTLLTPLAARTDYRLLIAVRILMGIFEGVTYPSMHAMLARWVPPFERNKFSTFVYTGAQVGTIITMPLVGILTTSFGWESVFYVIGTGALLWGICWMLLVYDTPEEHPRITAKELKYIHDGIGAGHERGKALPVPWGQMLRSKPFWALILVSMSTNWGFWLLLTELPTYLRNILHYDIKKNGFVSALPYFSMWTTSLVLSTVSDHFRKKGTYSFTTIRNINNSIAHFGPAICFVSLIFAGCNEYLSLALLIAAGTMQAGFWPGTITNHLDLAPNFAEFQILVDVRSAWFRSDQQQNLKNWAKVFWLAAGINVVGNGIFLAFGSSEEATWNRPRMTHDDPKNGGLPEPESQVRLVSDFSNPAFVNLDDDLAEYSHEPVTEPSSRNRSEIVFSL